MRKAKEILKNWDIRSTPRTEEAVKDAQREAWNEAIEAAAESAQTTTVNYTMSRYPQDDVEEVDKQSILKLKK